MESYNSDFSGGCACGGNCGCGGSEAAENRGLFISFEGIDGVGKTTQVEALKKHLQSLGREVVVTREPGGTLLGKSLREILLHGSFVAPRTEALLFAADRAQHVAEVIRPAIQRGAVVITDRYIDSSLAYQAGGREFTIEDIQNLSEWATDSLWPNRTYLLDMQPEEAFKRLHRQQDRMESAGIDFARRTREAFLDLAQENEERYRVLDATCSVQSLADLISKDVNNLIAKTESE